jgi:hypothetical protein
LTLTAVLCPHPPLLFRELGGRQDPAADLRAACADVLHGALADEPAAVIVIGGGDEPGSWPGDTAADVRRFGGTSGRTGSGLPLSLGVGRRLLDDAGWRGQTELVGLRWRATDDELQPVARDLAVRSEPVLVLLMGEGSARRGEKAPGFLDERSFGFDDAVAAALAHGDAAALRRTDQSLATELMVSGAAVLRLLGMLFPDGPERAELLWRDDPFGVTYLVSRWSA